jgi:hypothetical protein
LGTGRQGVKVNHACCSLNDRLIINFKERNMERFAIGDVVAFKTDPCGERYAVVDFADNKIILSDKGRRFEVSPAELLTAEETKNANEPPMPIFVHT